MKLQASLIFVFIGLLVASANAETLKIGKVVQSRYKTIDKYSSFTTEFRNDTYGPFVRTYLEERGYCYPSSCEESLNQQKVDVPVEGLIYEDTDNKGLTDGNNNPVVGQYWLRTQSQSGISEKVLCANVIETKSFPLLFLTRQETININCRPHIRADKATFAVRGNYFEFGNIPTLFVEITD